MNNLKDLILENLKKSTPSSKLFKPYKKYENWEHEVLSDSDDLFESEMDGKTILVAIIENKVFAIWYTEAKIGTILNEPELHEYFDEIEYCEDDPFYPF